MKRSISLCAAALVLAAGGSMAVADPVIAEPLGSTEIRPTHPDLPLL